MTESAPTWVVRHRPKGDTTATAAAVSVPAVTPAAAIEHVRSTLPAGHIVTSVARY